MKVVEIECDDPMDRSQYIPLDKVEMISLNADGSDMVRLSGDWYVCRNGSFEESVTEWWGRE